MPRTLTTATIVAAIVLALILGASVNAHAATSRSQPATREYVAASIVERGLHVAGEELRGTRCAFADRAEFTTKARARKACFVQLFGFMQGTRRNVRGDVVFDPSGLVRRDQMASIVQRLATQEDVHLPAHAAVFIDVSSRNVHEPAIRWGAHYRLIRGYATTPETFGPADPVTRRQVDALIDRVTAYWAGA